MQPRQKRLIQQAGAALLVLALIVYIYGQQQQPGTASNLPSGPGKQQQHTPASFLTPVAPSTAGSKQYLFVFGDSYSSHSHAGFVPTAPLVPTEENPLGYLPPDPNEGTFSGGDIWVDIFVKQSRPGTLVYNYATPGNVVNYTRLGSVFDPSLMAIQSPVKDMVTQLDHFETIHNKKVPWTGQNSIFFNWFGVNDLTATQLHSKLPLPEMKHLIKAQVGDFWTLVRRQYKDGARKFIHMLVPPMHRIPSYADFNPEMMPLAKQLAETWSEEFHSGNAAFVAEHSDAASLVFETADVFNHAMDHFADYGARNDNCFSYGKDTLCLWYDFLHPGEVIQREMGKGIFALSKKLPGQA